MWGPDQHFVKACEFLAELFVNLEPSLHLSITLWMIIFAGNVLFCLSLSTTFFKFIICFSITVLSVCIKLRAMIRNYLLYLSRSVSCWTMKVDDSR